MPSINKLILLGRVGGVEEIKLTGDRRMVRISLATDDGYKDKEGKWVDQVEWHRLVISIASMIDPVLNFQKGDELYVEGKIKTNKYSDKEGNPREEKSVWVDKITRMRKASVNNHQNSTNEQGEKPHQQKPPVPHDPFQNGNDDLNF